APNANQRIRRGRLSRRGFNDSVLRFFQKSDDALACHRREAFEKVIDCFTRLEIVEQRLHGNSRPMENGGSPHHVGAAGYDGLLHMETTSAKRPDEAGSAGVAAFR